MLSVPSLRPGAIHRRQMMQVGAFGAVGLTLPQLLCAEAQAKAARKKSCILIFANGGPAQLDTFDLKPDAPAEVRGEFKPITTNVPGIQICEHLPKLARLASEYALVRSVSHNFKAHPAAAYIALTGHPPARDALFPAQPSDFPSVGSVLSSLVPSDPVLPSYVIAPHYSFDVGNIQPGQLSGWLGSQAQPLLAEGDPSKPNFKVNNLTLAQGLTGERIDSRRELAARIDGRLEHLGKTMAARNLDSYYERAFNLLSSPAAKQAFEIDREPPAVRDRYGRHSYGQSYLLARRLVESGVRMVLVNDSFGRAIDRWDTHGGSIKPLRDKNLPETDTALSALLTDLKERGLLDSTLVIFMGEMGRTPKAPHNDHWPMVYSILMAGGGIKGGQVYGASDKNAAYPQDNPVSPGDVLATIYSAFGLSAETMIQDRESRPHHLFNGKPIDALFS
ncbi:MAG: DUF1501 domain-containing protein [Gemmataceae bacterium]